MLWSASAVSQVHKPLEDREIKVFARVDDEFLEIDFTDGPNGVQVRCGTLDRGIVVAKYQAYQMNSRISSGILSNCTAISKVHLTERKHLAPTFHPRSRSPEPRVLHRDHGPMATAGQTGMTAPSSSVLGCSALPDSPCPIHREHGSEV